VYVNQSVLGKLNSPGGVLVIL